MMQTVEGIWDGFSAEFLTLWTDAVAKGTPGDLNHSGLFPAEEASGSCLKVP